ncbi:MAG TPA: sigma factor-like helix-turn-helix DNA-binding protein [Acidimicrobiales bacterium]|nr:sigma factor-like helix-turn-helix DNA-binding protein [Acidimicrobiales bacterium]
MDEASVAESSSEGDDLGDALVDFDAVDEDFVATYKAHYPRLVRALELSGASRPSAEDVAQEAFARALVHWDRVRSGTNPAGYVYRVAFRLTRRSSFRKPPLVEEHATPTVDDEATLHVGIEMGLKTMPAARRRCAVLCLIVGMSTKDAAGTLHIAESTVRKQIERARKDLRIALKDDG